VKNASPSYWKFEFVAAVWAVVLAAVPNAFAGFVYETPTEFLTAGDFKGNGRLDVLVLDKATGNARVGYQDDQGVLIWSSPLVTGVQNVTGLAVGRLLLSSRDALAVTAPDLNRINLVDLSDARSAGVPQVVTPVGLGPHSLAALASPFPGPSPPLNYLLAASSLNNAQIERLDLMDPNSGSAPSAGHWRESGVFDRPNALTQGQQTLAVGLVRAQPAPGNTNDSLHIWSSGSILGAPAVLTSGWLNYLPAGSDYVFGNFNGESLPRFLFYVPGQSNVTIMDVMGLGGWSGSLAFTQAVRGVYYQDLGGDGCALIQFDGGIQSLTLTNGSPQLGPIYTDGAGTNLFTGVVPLGPNRFALLDAPAGSRASIHAQVVNFDGVTYRQLSSTNLPILTSAGTRPNVWLFQAEPFVTNAPGFLSSLSAPDWTDQATLAPAGLHAIAESDGGSANGLATSAPVNLGTPPAGATFCLANQYAANISLFSYSAPRAPDVSTVTISPPPGTYGQPIQLCFSVIQPGDRVFFRIGLTAAWRQFSTSFRLTNDATVQFYGVNAAGGRSRLQSAAYSFGRDVSPTPGTSSGSGSPPPRVNPNLVQLSSGGAVFYGRRQGSRGTIWVINLDGSGETYITAGARPRVSPDGHWLAFLREGDPFGNRGNLWVRELPTGLEWRLLVNTNSIVGFNWGSVGANQMSDFLIVDYACQLVRLDLAGAITPLTQGDCYRQPSLNPIDGSLAFQNLSPSGAALGLLGTNGAARPMLPIAVSGTTWPAWSADGQQLAFADSSGGSADAGRNLYLANVDGTGLRTITAFASSTDGFPHGAVWLPGDDSLVAAGSVGGTNGLWVIPLFDEGGNCSCDPELLPTAPGDPVDFAGSAIALPAPAYLVTETPTNLNANFSLASSPLANYFSGSGPVALLAADVNGDGYPDLVAADGGSGRILVATNDGTGAFVFSTSLSPGFSLSRTGSLAAADLNGDGYPDLVCADSVGNRLFVFLNDGHGNFPTSGHSFPVGAGTASLVAVADVDNDGYPDLICAGFQGSKPGTVTVLRNDHNGGFGPFDSRPAGGQPAAIVAADVNQDGFPDLICANTDQNALSLLVNDRHGHFPMSVSFSAGLSPVSVAAADVNGDGAMDLICANQDDNTLMILTNDTHGNFSANASSPLLVGNRPSSVFAADVNGDGATDLISANQDDNTLTVLTNDGAGGFALASTPAVGRQPITVLAAVLTRDGEVGLVSANSGDDSLTVLLGFGEVAPRIVQPPASLTVALGATVTLTVEAIGAGPLHYRWSKNGVVLNDYWGGAYGFSGSGTATLVLSQVSDASSASYTVTVSDDAGLTTSATAVLTVTNPPPLGLTDPLFDLATTIYQNAPGISRSPVALASADVNGDGKPDLIVANQNMNSLTVWTNDGSGGLVFAAELTVGQPLGFSAPAALAVADLNLDGFPDLVCADFTAGTLVVFFNDGHGQFPTTGASFQAGGGPLSVVAADVDGDGLPDLICANYWGNNVWVLLNSGGENFAPAPSGPLGVGNGPRSLATADLNGDGYPDLICANSQDNAVAVWTNGLGGTFSPSAGSPVPVGNGASTDPVSIALYDQGYRSLPGLVTANYNSSTLSGMGVGLGGDLFPTWAAGVGRGPNWVTVADVNGDGWPDLICANSLDNTLSVLTNDGSGNFTLASTLKVGIGPVAVIAIDLNGDHTTDLVSANAGDGTLTIIRGVVAQSPPFVSTLPATNVTLSAATLSASVTPRGPSVLWFTWGTNTTYGLTNYLGPVGAGNYADYIPNLSPNTLYHFQAFASNSVGTASGGDLSFSTASPPPRGIAIGPQKGSGAFQLQFSVTPGLAYTFQGSSNLVNWVDLSSFTAGPDGVLTFLDAAATNYHSRFYRLRQP